MPASRLPPRHTTQRALASSALLVALCSGPLLAENAVDLGWPRWGGDDGARRYSPLDQIGPGNVAELQVAWTWRVYSTAQLAASPELARATYFQSTPLVLAGRLYVTTPISELVSLDPTTGRELWRYRPGGWEQRPPNIGWVHRGVAAWIDPAAPSATRLFLATGDGHLIAVDAGTGTVLQDFGSGGRVDLTAGLRRTVDRRQYGVSSAPVVCRDTIIVGSSISEGAGLGVAPPGDVRGFDARTGALRWIFHTIPQPGEEGNETWEGESAELSGHANVWAPMSADPELGLVYLPTSTPTNDFYGGHRLGDDLFAESLVALDCGTGQRAWHFQIVHHGVWDYDLPAAPMLVDLTIGGAPFPAVAQLTKQGFVFVFDRRNGAPLWPIEERPVPQSTVPGERTAPTQPFPTKPPPFERQGFTRDDLIDYTPELRAQAEAEVARIGIAFGELYTPPSLEGVLQLPGYGGGANWPGGAFDPVTERLFVPSVTRHTQMALGPADPARSKFRYIRRGLDDLVGPDGLLPTKPPYSRITAYDLDGGEILWQVPNGAGPKDHPRLRHLALGDLGSGGRAGALVTKTLLFVTEGTGRTGSTRGGGGPRMRAFDKDNGATLATFDLPADATGPPMTYAIAGRQYVVVPVGSSPPQLVALALPAIALAVTRP